MRRAERGGKSVYLDVGIWWNEDQKSIHMTVKDAPWFHTTVREDQKGKRGHPNLFYKLAKCLRAVGAPHPPIPNGTDEDVSDRTSAIGLARYARDYYEAAEGADEVLGDRPGYERSAPAPVMHLVAHAIELILKAYLRHRGQSVKDITKLRHRLVKCWDAAVNLGLEDHVTLTSEEMDTLQLICHLHSSTQLRYIQIGWKELPAYGPLQNLVEKLLDAICPVVGYQEWEG